MCTRVCVVVVGGWRGGETGVILIWAHDFDPDEGVCLPHDEARDVRQLHRGAEQLSPVNARHTVANLLSTLCALAAGAARAMRELRMRTSKVARELTDKFS